MKNIHNNLKYNMTRIRSLLAVIVLAIMMITLSVNRYTVLADNDEVVDDNGNDTTGEENSNEVAKSTEKIYVDDAAELIPDGEEVKLVEKCKKLSDKCKVDIGIATTTDAKGLSSKEYAQESVLNNNLGYEDDDRFDKSAVLFLVDLDNKETYIVTEGLGILLIEDDDIEYILDDVYAYIDSDLNLTDFYKVCDVFLDSVSNTMLDNYDDYGYDYMDDWEKFDGTYEEFDKKYVNVEHGPFYILRNPIPCLIIALIVAGVAVAFMSYSNKARMTVTGNTYMDKNEFRMHVCSDRYINTTTTKTRISSESSGGGGGSHGGSHSSGSGGHSFGGGGRSL